MWIRALLKIGRQVFASRKVVSSVGSGSKIAKHSKGFLSWVKSWFSNSASAPGKGLSTVVNKTITGFGAKQAASLGRTNLFRKLSSRVIGALKSKTFKDLVMIEGAFLGVEYLVDNFGMSQEEARILVNELVKNGFPDDFDSPFDADTSDDLRRLDVSRLTDLLGTLTQFKVAGANIEVDRAVENMLDPMDRSILLGKLVDAIEIVLGADEFHIDEDHAAVHRLQAVRALLHGNPFTGYVYEGIAHKEQYLMGADTALSNLILSDKEIATDYAQSFVDDHDKWFDFQDVDKDSKYFQALKLVEGATSGMPSWLITELDVEDDDVHEISVMKDLVPALYNKSYVNRIKNYIRN